MKFDLKILIFLISLLASGCVTRAVQTEALLQNPNPLPQKYEIKNVPFINQSVGYCGPATLTMALNWSGSQVTIDQIASQVFTPGLAGSLQTDLISASRRQGYHAIQIQDLKNLLTEVAAGHPVIIFENLSLSWAPQWHYALVIGYDLNKQEIIMHSGHDAYFHWDLKKFERSWMLGEYWGLIILKPDQLSETASQLSHVTSAVGLEQANQKDAAEKSYRKILEKWPRDLVAPIGLANILFEKKNNDEAIAILKKAVQENPNSQAARHNLEVAIKQKLQVRK